MIRLANDAIPKRRDPRLGLQVLLVLDRHMRLPVWSSSIAATLVLFSWLMGRIL